MIQAIPISITGRGTDILAWVGNSRGSFDVKNAYSIAMDTDSTISFTANWIWKSETFPRIKNIYGSVLIIVLELRSILQGEEL